MLTFTRPHRQAIATFAMLSFTVAPTVFVAWTSWRINRPAMLHEVELELGRELGLKVSLEGLRHPRPGEDVLRGVGLGRSSSTAGDEAEFARADLVRVVRDEREIVLETQGLRIRGESPRQALNELTAVLQRRGGSGADRRRITVLAPTCLIVWGNKQTGSLHYELRDVAGTVQAEREGEATALKVSYRILTERVGTRCELALSRDERGSAVRTTLVLQTAEGPPLPARVLDPFFPSADWLGESARVEGSLTLSQSGAADWTADFNGDLVNVDLSSLVGKRFRDHRMTGLARIRLDGARWADRPGHQGMGWIEARGLLTVGRGTIGVKLLRSLAAEMKFRLNPKLDPRGADVSFDRLGIGFVMKPDGEIRIDGGLGTDSPPGAVILDRSQLVPVAFAPEGAANHWGLVRALFPNSDRDVMVKAAPEAHILHFLPVPPGVSTTATAPTGN